MPTRYIAIGTLTLLLLLGCGQGRQKPDLEPDSGETNQSASTSIATQVTDLVSKALTNKAVKLGDLPDESQIKVLVCDYVIRNRLNDEVTVIFALVNDVERHALASRLPGYKLQSITDAEATEDGRRLRDKQSKETGVKLEVTALEIDGRQARALVLAHVKLRVDHLHDFELEKTDEWHIRKVAPTEILDRHPVK